MKKIQLIDRNGAMCDEWHKYFSGFEDVVIHNGDFFSLKTDCVVSPANSFGFMDGGLDAAITKKLGWSVENNLQRIIRSKYDGELLVGQAELVDTNNDEIPFCISAPTMRVPMQLKNSVNIYLAAKAAFRVFKNDDRINTITISGLGTGVGKVPYDICARQMRAAYDFVMLDKKGFPYNWKFAQMNHQALYKKVEDYTDLQFGL